MSKESSLRYVLEGRVGLPIAAWGQGITKVRELVLESLQFLDLEGGGRIW